jgi:parallel beta-helix repeat protein
MLVFEALRKLFSTPTPTDRRPLRRAMFRPQVEALEGRWVPTTISVGSGSSIQAAVNMANPGDTISIAGIHAESVSITTNNISLVGQAGAEINAPPGISGTGAIVDVNGATHVTINGLLINGEGEAMDAAVRVRGGGSATIENNTIENTYTAGANQLGYSIRVGDNGDVLGSLSPGVAKIENNILESYNKGGIIVDGSGSAGTIIGNTVTGEGLIPTIAQNGVQISNGATGRIQSNAITENNYNTTGDLTAVAVVIFNTNTNIVVALNVMDSNGSGLNVLDCSNSNTLVANNSVTHSTYDGIILTNSNNVDVCNNYINFGGGDGISLSGSNNNTIVNNSAYGSSTYGGIYLSYSNGNIIEGNDLENNADDGIQMQNANGNQLIANVTAGNSVNGIEIDTGTGNLIIFDASATNALDGIQLNDTVNTTIEASAIVVNGRYGISLFGSTGTTIELNIIAGNAAGAIYIDNQSSCTVIQCNLIFGTITHEAVGAAATTATVQSSVSDADAATANL